VKSSVTVERTDYLIGPEDILLIEVWKEPDLTRKVTVQPDGKISLPLLNDVKVIGLSVQEIKQLLEEEFLKYLEIPSVSVSVVDPKSYKIYVVGKVKAPGVIQPKSQITFLQAIATAGGFSEWAKKKEILVNHFENGVEKSLKINYEKIISGESPELNIVMQSGDTIIVP
jgi:polysaccharide export outer membrane protein